MRVSVIVVSYNTRERLRACLERIERHHELIVVDNGSKDSSAEMVRGDFEYTKLIANDRNLGFGAACNQGLDAMTGRYALLLNSDCEAESGAIDALADFLDGNEDYMACGGRLLTAEGATQPSSANRLTLWAVFCEQTYLESLGVFRPYWNTLRLPVEGPSDTWQVMGACLMMRPVARFDERFFLYCEDTEICHRLNEQGKIAYVPSAKFLHWLGESSKGVERWLAVARYNRGKELYFAMHHGALASAVCIVFDRLGAFARMLVWCWRPSLAVMWRRVLTAPMAGPPNPLDTSG